MDVKPILKTVYYANYRVAHRLMLADYYPPAWPTIRQLEQSTTDTKHAVREALRWLFRSQDANPDDGGSAAFFKLHLSPGWSGSYPETTGYIITTLQDALEVDWICDEFGPELIARSQRMANWLLTLQRPDGSFPGGVEHDKSESSIFNTAQILDGLLAIGIRENNTTYLDAAERAASWLTDRQADDGSWTTNLYDVECRTYLCHAAWPLAKAGEVNHFKRSSEYRDAAKRFADWAITFQTTNGWIEKWSFKLGADDDEINTLHTIAYTIEGLLEMGFLWDDEALLAAASSAAERLLRRFEVEGVLWGEYDNQWRKQCDFVCVTGVAQTSRCWLLLYQHTGDARYLNAALKANEALRRVQYANEGQPNTYGGFTGSNPIRGRYMTYCLPNWATKYALDALMLEEHVVSTLRMGAN